MLVEGKGGMVWKLRNWEDGDSVKQLAQCRELGLDWISIKIADGRDEKWEGSIPLQNADLILATLAMLRNGGVNVIGWTWIYGGSWVFSSRKWIFRPSVSASTREGEAQADICDKYAIKHVQIDAEHHWNGKGLEDARAEAYMLAFEGRRSGIEHSLCSYRFPLTHQPAFPVETFATYMEAWCPQVYFVQDTRVDGGARQLDKSFWIHVSEIEDLPYFGIAPTYLHRWKDSSGKTHDWRATKEQLTKYFEKAVELGNPAVGVWDLPQASQDQLDALGEFDGFGQSPPPEPEPIVGKAELRHTKNVDVVVVEDESL